MKLYTVDFKWLYNASYNSDEENAKNMELKTARAEWLRSIGHRVEEHEIDHPTSVMLSGDQTLVAMELGFVFELKSTRDFGGQGNFEHVAAKQTNTPPTELAYNTRCEVHVPGQALSLYNEVMLASDACSDAMQNHLDDGWRIIAACPQPDQRRPDYILGRYNPKHESKGDMAARG